MILTIKTILDYIVPFIPFLSVAYTKKEGSKSFVSVLISRLLEIGILGAVLMYSNSQVMHNEVTNLKEAITTQFEIQREETKNIEKRLITNEKEISIIKGRLMNK